MERIRRETQGRLALGQSSKDYLDTVALVVASTNNAVRSEASEASSSRDD